jgi:hypothetical protein
MSKLILRTDQRGMGHLGTIMLIVVIAGALGMTGYRVNQSRKDKTQLQTVADTDKTAVRACNDVIQDRDLCRFTGKYNLDGVSFQMTITTSGKDGTGTSVFQSDGRGNTSMTQQIDGLSSSFILLGKVSYMKDNTDGKWFKFPPSDSSVPKPTNPNNAITVGTTDKTATSNLTYKKLGKEACGKLTCFKYQMIDKASPETVTYFWFDDVHYQLQHHVVQDSRGTTDYLITYQPVTITVPTPTKDLSGSFDEQALKAAQAAAAAASTQQQ